MVDDTASVMVVGTMVWLCSKTGVVPLVGAVTTIQPVAQLEPQVVEPFAPTGHTWTGLFWLKAALRA